MVSVSVSVCYSYWRKNWYWYRYVIYFTESVSVSVRLKVPKSVRISLRWISLALVYTHRTTETQTRGLFILAKFVAILFSIIHDLIIQILTLIFFIIQSFYLLYYNTLFSVFSFYINNSDNFPIFCFNIYSCYLWRIKWKMMD